MSEIVQCGSGKDLLFLHGYMANKESFSSEIRYFSKEYRVTALDFPGFSTPIPWAWNVGDYADWLKNKLEELNVSRPLVIAHSFGGRVAIKANCFEKMLLVGCAGIVHHGIKYRAKVTAYKIMKRISPQRANTFGSEEYKALSPLMRESYKKIVNEDLRKDANKITVPVLYVYGKGDETTPPSMGRKLWRATKGSEFRLIDGGHFAYLDDPVSFRIVAEEFFERR